MSRYLIVVLTLVFILSVSCKKEEGLFFLRVIPPADTLISGLEVFHAGGPVPVDGKYYPVSEWAEVKYTLSNMLQSQILDWNETMYFDEFTYYDENKHEYLGEFERSTFDKYFTLQVGYIVDKRDEPYYNQWFGYYYQFWDYLDNSQLTWTKSPEE